MGWWTRWVNLGSISHFSALIFHFGCEESEFIIIIIIIIWGEKYVVEAQMEQAGRLLTLTM